MNKAETKKMLTAINERFVEEEAFERISRLNLMILLTDGLDEGNFINPSLFLKLRERSFEELWNESVKPALQGVFEGRPDKKQKLKECEAAYRHNEVNEA